MNTITIGMAGAGWAAAMHAHSYQKIHGIECKLKTVCAIDEGLENFAERYGFSSTTAQYLDLLNDDEIDVIDIVTPPSLHADMVKKALQAGKHVICEKPLTGFFQRQDGGGDSGAMLDAVLGETDAIGKTLAESGRTLCYAENWLYSPPFLTMLDLLAAKKTSVMLIEGATGHNGSHAPHARYWEYNGGGALIRQGTHPVAAALHLKQIENRYLGNSCTVREVWCDSSRLAASSRDSRHLPGKPVDVEDWARVIITYSDNSKADIMAGDILLGGIVNRMAVHGHDASYRCNMTPNNLLESYYADADGLEAIEVMEKASHNNGWMTPLVAPQYIRGYEGQAQDFIEAVSTGRQPRSTFALARDTLAVIYGAYMSSETRRPVSLTGLGVGLGSGTI